MHGGTGHNEVADAGQSREGGLPGAQGDPQPGGFGEAPGHEHGLGVVAEAHAVHNSGAQGDDVFQRTPQLRTHRVGTGVDPEGVGHKGVLDKFRQILVLAGGETPRGDAPGDLLGVGGAREDHHLVSRLLGRHLAHPQMGALL